MPNKFAPYHPIIYVRGFAGTQGEIDETVADPYMGFNIGSTKARQVWNGALRRYYFESPLVRLTDEPLIAREGGVATRLDERYDDVYLNGEDLTASQADDPYKPARSDITLPYHSIAILRYYDVASSDFGDKQSHPIEEFALALAAQIIRMRELICSGGRTDPFRGEKHDNHVSREEFRVHLVAHSMGGLVCRALLQNASLGSGRDREMASQARSAVDKLFTYATPHNGIDLRIVRNVPAWSALGEATNFNRGRMAQFLGLPKGQEDVASLGQFPADRVFNLVGTNPADYLVAKGLSSWAVGESSDGLVRMDNATTHGVAGDGSGEAVDSPNAYVHRSHSGHFGIVNSEEGYQNLTRFLFGAVRADGFLEIESVGLPDAVQKEKDAGRDIKASYQVEVVASIRGAHWQLHRRIGRENSAIQLKFDEIFPKKKDGKRESVPEQAPRLFTIFLDPSKSVSGSRSIAFSFEIRVLVPDYEVDGVLWLKQHFEGSSLAQRFILVEAIPDAAEPGDWRIQYGSQEQVINSCPEKAQTTIENGALVFRIDAGSPAGSRPGIAAKLRVELRNRELS
jgi:hypothetical protein